MGYMQLVHNVENNAGRPVQLSRGPAWQPATGMMEICGIFYTQGNLVQVLCGVCRYAAPSFSRRHQP
jgi:hypothetical protein